MIFKSGYYWTKHKDKNSWLDCSPEIVYVYFDGKYSVFRPGQTKAEKIDNFEDYRGPLECPYND